ncbi:MAG TPA: hypothetical protein VMW89_15705 [Desulfatiglandales bacterium]|nr:hypothetical protein [Desulfatiglandales bacterium]
MILVKSPVSEYGSPPYLDYRIEGIYCNPRGLKFCVGKEKIY